jgi:hypothetical protein
MQGPMVGHPQTDRNQNLAHATAGQNLDVDELGLPPATYRVFQPVNR